MGQQATCNRCEFEFFGGHSHHEGHSNGMCLQCRCNFVLLTNDLWGPEIGEKVRLLRRVVTGKGRKQKVRYTHTDTLIRTVAGEGEWGGCEYLIAETPCPECGHCTLALGFEKGARCPACSEGELRVDFVEY